MEKLRFLHTCKWGQTYTFDIIPCFQKKIEFVYCLEKQWARAKDKCRFGLKTQSGWCWTRSWQNKYPLCAGHFPHYKGSLCGSQGILKWLWEKCCIKSNFWDEGLNGFHHWRRNDRNLNYDLAIWENKKLPFWVRLMASLPISRQEKEDSHGLWEASLIYAIC